MATVKYLDTKLYDFLTLFLSACCIKSDSDIQSVLSPMLEVCYLFRNCTPDLALALSLFGSAFLDPLPNLYYASHFIKHTASGLPSCEAYCGAQWG